MNRGSLQSFGEHDVRYVPDQISDEYMAGHDACLAWFRAGARPLTRPVNPYLVEGTWEWTQWRDGFEEAETTVSAKGLQR